MDKIKLRTINILFISLALLSPLSAGLARSVSAEEFVISGNGESSSSQISVTQNNPTAITQNNEAALTNEVDVTSNTGDNEASANTGGDTLIETGSTSTTVEIENSANSQIVDVGCCAAGGSAEISGNGANSGNQINFSQNNPTTVNVSNNAAITTDIQGYANTGKNTANNNSGDVTIRTGSIFVENSIKNGPINIASVSVTSGQTLDFLLKIHGNGSNSDNKIALNSNNDTSVNIVSRTILDNILDWYLNTGQNVANDNNGDVLIATGDIDFVVRIDNGPINSSIVDIDCCRDGDPGEENPQPNDNPSNPTTSGGTSGNGGGGSGGGGSVLGAAAAAVGNILPNTGGNWTLIMTLISGILFALGLYLRLHPGNDPGKKLAFA